MTANLYKLYDSIVAQARQAPLYRLHGICDDFDTRFDMLVLHLILVLRHMRRAGSPSKQLHQLIHVFFDDMDQTLRELGIGDLGMTHRMRKMGEAFYGRQRAYNAALNSDASHIPKNALALKQALARNFVLDMDTHDTTLTRLANYVLRLEAQYASQALSQLLRGHAMHEISLDS